LDEFIDLWLINIHEFDPCNKKMRLIHKILRRSAAMEGATIFPELSVAIPVLPFYLEAQNLLDL
jgi:hypothetical protein